MMMMNAGSRRLSTLVIAASLLGLAACADRATLPPAGSAPPVEDALYRIGPGDGLQIFVWRNPELSLSVPVRPDGRISVPLIDDLYVEGQTSTQVARHIEEQLSTFVQSPVVTVMVSNFVGPFAQQVRVIGQAAQPQAIPYRANMTLLDVMIAVGGTTEFAAGNRATLVRSEDGQQREYRVRIDDLLKNGDISANVQMQAGDVLIIPESWF